MNSGVKADSLLTIDSWLNYKEIARSSLMNCKYSQSFYNCVRLSEVPGIVFCYIQLAEFSVHLV